MPFRVLGRFPYQIVTAHRWQPFFPVILHSCFIFTLLLYRFIFNANFIWLESGAFSLPPPAPVSICFIALG